MITTKDIIQAMDRLSEKRKLFWSEADFQFSLALVLQDMIPDGARIYLERPIAEILSAQQKANNTKNRNKFYIDIFIQIDNTIYPIELKYGTRKQDIEDDDKKVVRTVNQAAYDITRFGYLFDIYRIEQIKKHLSGSNELKFGRGFAIMLTNDANYYTPPTKDISNTRDANFRLHQGNSIKKVEWNIKDEEVKHWTKSQYPYNKSFTLQSKFKPDWRSYGKDNGIKYLINTIEADIAAI